MALTLLRVECVGLPHGDGDGLVYSVQMYVGAPPVGHHERGCRVALHTPAQGSADGCCGLRHIPAQIPWWFLPLLVAHIHLGEMNAPGTRRGQRTTRSPCHAWRCQRATCLSQHFLRLFLFIFLPHWDEMKAFPVLCMEAALCCSPVLTAELECLLLAGSLGWDVGKPSSSHPAPAGESWDRPYSSSNIFQPIPLPTKTAP